MADVFISYSTADQETADKIADHLEENGFSCWIATRNIAPGSIWERSIVKAINDAKVFLLLYSKNSAQSEQVENELRQALKRKTRIVPYKLDETELDEVFSYHLEGKNWIAADVKNGNYNLEPLTGIVRTVVDLSGEQAGATMIERKYVKDSKKRREQSKSETLPEKAEKPAEQGNEKDEQTLLPTVNRSFTGWNEKTCVEDIDEEFERVSRSIENGGTDYAANRNKVRLCMDMLSSNREYSKAWEELHTYQNGLDVPWGETFADQKEMTLFGIKGVFSGGIDSLGQPQGRGTFDADGYSFPDGEKAKLHIYAWWFDGRLHGTVSKKLTNNNGNRQEMTHAVYENGEINGMCMTQKVYTSSKKELITQRVCNRVNGIETGRFKETRTLYEDGSLILVRCAEGTMSHGLVDGSAAEIHIRSTGAVEVKSEYIAGNKSPRSQRRKIDISGCAAEYKGVLNHDLQPDGYGVETIRRIDKKLRDTVYDGVFSNGEHNGRGTLTLTYHSGEKIVATGDWRGNTLTGAIDKFGAYGNNISHKTVREKRIGIGSEYDRGMLPDSSDDGLVSTELHPEEKTRFDELCSQSILPTDAVITEEQGGEYIEAT